MNIFSSSPNPSFLLCRPTSFPTVLTAAPNFLPILARGGGWCLNHVPLAHRRLRRCYRLLHPSDHPVHHGISRRSRGDAPLIFFDRDPAPVPVSPMWSTICAAVKFSLLRLVHGIPGYPDIVTEYKDSLWNKSSVLLDYIEFRTRLNQFECHQNMKTGCPEWKNTLFWMKTVLKENHV